MNPQVIGFIAATCTTISFLPQVVKSWKTRETKDLSLPMCALLTAGIAMWLVYGILRSDPPVIIANIISGLFTGSLLFLKIKYG